MLFEPYDLAATPLANRMVMAPMTRCRAGQPGNVPTPMTTEYYTQRASAGLIVSEGAQVSPSAVGYLWTPGIHSAAQVEGWRRVADAVHEQGGRLFIQLWHCGRISHTSIQPGGASPVGPTARAADSSAFGHDDAGQPSYLPCSTPHPATPQELTDIVADFRRACENAAAAGVDGVEIHAANGYLFDQFLNGALNDRDDAYGGSLANRARLLLKVVGEAVGVLGAGRVGVRLSPHGSFNDMPADPQADEMALHLADALGGLGIAYLHMVDPVFNGYADGEQLLREVRRRFGGTVIACGDMDLAKAERYLGAGLADLIGFGRPFIANPDLPRRLAGGAPLAEADPATIYGGDAHGYTDYPALDATPHGEPS